MSNLTEEQRKFVDAMLGDAKGDPKLAKEMAGYAESTSAAVVMSSKAVSEALVNETKTFIQQNAPRAAHLFVDVLTGVETLGVKERTAVAEKILGIAGISKTEKVEVEAKNPLFILPSKKDEPEDEDD